MGCCSAVTFCRLQRGEGSWSGSRSDVRVEAAVKAKVAVHPIRCVVLPTLGRMSVPIWRVGMHVLMGPTANREEAFLDCSLVTIDRLCFRRALFSYLSSEKKVKRVRAAARRLVG